MYQVHNVDLLFVHCRIASLETQRSQNAIGVQVYFQVYYPIYLGFIVSFLLCKCNVMFVFLWLFFR